MKVLTPVLNSADTAVLLRARLGPLRSWPDFLTDSIRRKQDIEGYRLLPSCRLRDRRGFRPYYAVADIEEFIRCVLAADENAGRVPIRAKTVMIDLSLPWRMNKFERNGAPAAAPGAAPHYGTGWHG
jgi:hypothetical protein